MTTTSAIGPNPGPARLTDKSAQTARKAFPTVMFDEAHQQAWTIDRELAVKMNPGQPDDSSLVKAAQRLGTDGFKVVQHAEGMLTAEVLEGVDVLVTAHPSDGKWERTTGAGSPVYTPAEMSAIDAFVRAGGGLVVLSEHEQDKYGNNVNELLAQFGVCIENTTVTDVPASFRGVAAWVKPELDAPGQGLLTRVDEIVMYRAGVIATTADGSQTLAAAGKTSSTPGQAMLVTAPAGAGRIVVSSDSDLFGDDSIGDADHSQLFTNLVTWACLGTVEKGPQSGLDELPSAWKTLKAAVTELRDLQLADGSLDKSIEGSTERAASLVDVVTGSLEELSPLFPHQAEHLSLTVTDLRKWVQAGFGVPDFLDSLNAFRPDLHRADAIEHIAVFPMYTQNGNPGRVMEAVWIATVWPEWVAEVEANGYNNKAFVPIRFIDFTAGYQTHSATFFPETVAVRETPVFHWGGIFCDRESARFQAVISRAASILKMQTPPDAQLLLSNREIARETFVLWDLVHDRTHSHGDLPFDPFMIKQRMPFWMYALEELRCDLNTYVESANLELAGIPQARLVRYAIVFDRLFRFSVTGERVRNYDGLGGQIIFAHLHRTGILRWTDNTLVIDWSRIDEGMKELWEHVNALYRSGIDMSRVGYWRAAYQLVSELVAANPGSVWSNGIDLSLPTKDLVNAVLPDEFPLNVFFEALRTKLADVITSTKGIC